MRMQRITYLFSILLFFVSIPLQGKDQSEPRYLMPTSPQQKTEDRSTYDSLTEERGTFQLIKEQQIKKDEEAKRAQEETAPPETTSPKEEGPIINFNNVNITEVLKYASRLTGKNFLYDPQELQFPITMISDTPASIEEVMAMLIQSLRAHGYSILEEGGSFIIHTNPTVKTIGALEKKGAGIAGPQIATQVFVLQNNDADRCAAVIKTMVTEGAIVEAVGDSKIIVSDVTENLQRIADVIKQLEIQSGALEIGQYVAINASPTTLVAMCGRILEPLAANKALVLVPHSPSNSIFIVSTPFLIEKALSIMQTIDLKEAESGIFSEEKMKFDAQKATEARQKRSTPQDEEEKEKEEQERALFEIHDDEIDFLGTEELRERLLTQGFRPEKIDTFTLEAARTALRRAQRAHVLYKDLPVGTAETTQFHIYQLQYRKSDDVAKALHAIANSIAATQKGEQGKPSLELSQADLLLSLNSIQTVEENNTLVFTGTKTSVIQVKNLIRKIDQPARQVFIEALVLDTTLTNSLEFGVEWNGKIQRTNLGAGIGFRNPNSGAGSFGAYADGIRQLTPVQIPPPPESGGISIGFGGRKIKFRGLGFRSTAALIRALHSDDENHIILNPKIITEHNVPAEIFVGERIPIKGESIANASIGGTSSIVATNYEIQETGVSLKVTPLVSTHDTVSLIIEQSVSFANSQEVQAQGQETAPPATVNEARTVTRVHLPSEHFLVLSGMIRDNSRLKSDRIPCLGGLPLIGSLFGTKKKDYNKRNLMVFIRPIIIDTPREIDAITKQQEDILKAKSRVQQGWNKEVDDMKEMLNIAA